MVRLTEISILGVITTFLFQFTIQVHSSPTESFYRSPAVNYTWRENHTNEIAFDINYPYTADRMHPCVDTKDFNSSVLSFSNLMQKLSTPGETIHIVIMGGSVIANYPTNFFHRFCTWLKHAYPSVNLKIHSLATSSTASTFGLSQLHDFHLESYDLLLCGYAPNDIQAMGLETSALHYITESIVRLALKHGSAVIYMSEVMLSQDSEKVYFDIAHDYGTLALSYRSTVISEVLQNPRMIFWGAKLGDVHPPLQTHQFICDLIVYAFTIIVKDLQLYLSYALHNEMHLPKWNNYAMHLLSLPPIYQFKDGNESVGACSAPITVMTSIPNTKSTVPFEPNTKYMWRCPKGVNCSRSGWNFTSDIPGKPMGWIADSASRPINQTTAHIAFDITMLQGAISLLHLQTYQNAGIMKVWVSTEEHIVKHYCDNRKKDKNLLLEHYPYIALHVVHSDPVYIDTYQNHSSTSEVKFTNIIIPQCQGAAILHVSHTTLPDVERKWRGGDKVKLLGIRAC
jgi:hypothetical protein